MGAVIDDVEKYLRAGNKLTGEDAATLFRVHGYFGSMIRTLRKRLPLSSGKRPNLTRNGSHKVYFVRGE